MSWWVRYVLHPRVWTETSRSETVPHIGSYMNLMGPRSIVPPLFTPSIYFLLLVSVAVTTIIISCVLSFVNSKAGGIDNPSVLVGRKFICCCVQVQVK